MVWRGRGKKGGKGRGRGQEKICEKEIINKCIIDQQFIGIVLKKYLHPVMQSFKDSNCVGFDALRDEYN